MKTIIFLFVILISTTCLAADGFVSFEFRDGNSSSYPNGGIAKWRTEIEVGQTFDSGFRPWTSVSTLMDRYGSGTFHPSSVDYRIGLDYKYKYILISGKHVCWHPIDESGDTQVWNGLEFKYLFSDK